MTTKEKKIPVTKTQITKHGDELVFYVGNHRYTVNKTPSWGTSVITSDSDKPALVWWAQREAIKQLYNTYKSNKGLTTEDFNNAYGCHQSKSKSALTVGSAVHKTAEYFCQFKLGEINEEQYRLRVNALEDTLDKDKKEDIKYKKALEAFKKWYVEEVDELLKTEFLVHHRETFFTTQIDIKFRNKKGEIIIANYKTSSDIYEEQHIQGCLEYVAYLDTFEKDIAKHQILCFYKEDVFDKSPTLRFLKINETGEDGEQFHYAGELAVVDTELALIPVALGKASITKIRKQNPVDINTEK